MLIDTNVWSELLRPRPLPAAIELLSARQSDVFLSTIVVAEMEFGIAKTKDPVRRGILRDFLDDILQRCEDRLVAPDLSAAKVFGAVKARLRADGNPIADLDLMIAAQANSSGMPLVTRNVSDMARTGADIINPWAP
jgi:predicted nucleic acid-binding protein